MAERDDGGPAFPGFHYTEGHGSQRRNANGEWETFAPGASLRDYFAAKAMQGLCANSGAAFQANDRTGWGLVNVGLDEVANLSYDMADAMLKARQA